MIRTEFFAWDKETTIEALQHDGSAWLVLGHTNEAGNVRHTATGYLRTADVDRLIAELVAAREGLQRKGGAK